MNSFTTVALETLEGRMLYSTTPSPTILADMAAVQSDKDQINVDRSSGEQTARGDDLKLAQDRFARLSQVSTLRVKLMTDTENDQLALLTDQITGLSKRLADRTVITNDFMKIKADRGDSAAEGVDATKLATDQGTLANDIAAATTTYKNDQSTFKLQLLSDRLAILTVRVDTDPGVMADKLKIVTDKFAAQLVVLADQKQLLIDEIKLATDKKAGL